ncbi:hypothetical protein [Thiohalophilus sp.]|uniref:hypothetical protein n=1 Tax=Thiohalophilus sp. TaxID=3028392 RepID=UPI003976736C
MSDSITLSDDLIHGIYNVIVQHDPNVEKNMMLALQYLSAVSGYLAAGYPGGDNERDEVIDQLAAFAKHVAAQEAQDSAAEQQPAAAAPQGRSEQTDDPAVGIWKPE